MADTRTLCAGLAVALLISFGCSVARAQELYEEERTRDVLAREGLVAMEPAEAEGRTIGFVRIVRDDVFVEEDGGILGWLTWANIFHTRTIEVVVRRELLLNEGEPYREELAEETMRNLRELTIFSYARVVPVRARRDDRVGLLVYTRDLWSLRLETNFQITGAVIDNLQLQLTERNLLGRQKRGSLRFVLVPDTFRFGQSYTDRRLFGGRLRLAEAVDLIFNRDSGSVEGVAIGASLRSPFYDLRQRWGFEVAGTVLTEVERRIRNGDVVPYDIPETLEEEAIPQVFREREYTAAARLLYRRGEGFKQTFGAGFEYSEVDVEPNEETGLSPGQEVAFARDVMPRELRDIGPVFSYDLFTPTFETFENLAAYGVSENVRVGPSVELEIGFPLRFLGSTSNSITLNGRYGMVLEASGLLAEASVAAQTRFESGQIIDQRLEAQLRGASPMLFDVFRIVWRLRWEGRRNDTTRSLVTLGGDNGLRGFVSQSFFTTGGNLLNGNFELRTAPLVLWSVHAGAVLFYDVGAVYDSVDDVTLHHAVGLGVRVMFPQFNRFPFRFDAGIPLPDDEPSIVPSFGAAQVIPLSELEDLQFDQ